ncbi:MAG TPA: hypothetical protein VIJ78_08820 [Pseudolabrys sp.]
MDKTIGRIDIASALFAEIAAKAEIIPSKFGQPYFKIPKYLGNLAKAVNGKKRANDFGKGVAARISDENGNPTFAELVVADRLRRSGWDCVWYSAFSRKIIETWPYDADEPQCRKFPESACKILHKISMARQKSTGTNKVTFSGMPDVIACRQDDLVMIECKQAGKDHLRSSQAEWFQCAKLIGLSANQFGIYEWTFQGS